MISGKVCQGRFQWSRSSYEEEYQQTAPSNYLGFWPSNKTIHHSKLKSGRCTNMLSHPIPQPELLLVFFFTNKGEGKKYWKRRKKYTQTLFTDKTNLVERGWLILKPNQNCVQVLSCVPVSMTKDRFHGISVGVKGSHAYRRCFYQTRRKKERRLFQYQWEKHLVRHWLLVTWQTVRHRGMARG